MQVGFTSESKERVLYVQAIDETDRDLWIDSIRQCEWSDNRDSPDIRVRNSDSWEYATFIRARVESRWRWHFVYYFTAAVLISCCYWYRPNLNHRAGVRVAWPLTSYAFGTYFSM